MPVSATVYKAYKSPNHQRWPGQELALGSSATEKGFLRGGGAAVYGDVLAGDVTASFAGEQGGQALYVFFAAEAVQRDAGHHLIARGVE